MTDVTQNSITSGAMIQFNLDRAKVGTFAQAEQADAL